MKTKILLLVCFFAFFNVTKAAVLIVDNNSTNPDHYVKIADAIKAASDGDIIYIIGSPLGYGGFTITKPLTIIGAGYFSENQYKYTTVVSGISIDKNVENVIITGLSASIITGGGNNNNKINRCYVGTISSLNSNWIISQNVIGSIYLGSARDIVIANNIITSFIRADVDIKSPMGIIVDHNVFLANYPFDNLKYAKISNNVFYSYSVSGATFCDCNNNCTYRKNGGSISFEDGTNTTKDNYENVNPEFADISISGFSLLNDYTVTNPSLISSDIPSTIIGVTGGQYAWTPHVPPSIPQIVTLSIENSVVPAGGTLQINAHVKSQD